MKKGRKAQIAMEYFILSSVIMVSVAIIFTFSFLNFSQNLRVAKANEALAKIAEAVDDVYVRGQENTRFVKGLFPDAMTKLKIVHKCVEGAPASQGSLTECGGTYDDVSFSTISMEVQLLGGNREIMRKTEAKIFANSAGNIPEISEQNPRNPVLNKYSGSSYTLKVSWHDDGERIQLEKV